jgi:hypothetical protein
MFTFGAGFQYEFSQKPIKGSASGETATFLKISCQMKKYLRLQQKALSGNDAAKKELEATMAFFTPLPYRIHTELEDGISSMGDEVEAEFDSPEQASYRHVFVQFLTESGE